MLPAFTAEAEPGASDRSYMDVPVADLRAAAGVFDSPDYADADLTALFTASADWLARRLGVQLLNRRIIDRYDDWTSGTSFAVGAFALSGGC